jgi:TRAP-type C4-dicarboxylate transport system permease large subunit
MPPTPKPQVKKKEAEEGKEKAKAVKAKKAVAAALLLFMVLAAGFAYAQNTAQNATSANQAKGSADKVVGEITGWATGGAGLVITLFGAMFWAAVGIAIFHIAMSYIAPTRFQRLGAMWDAVERAKDIAIGLAVLFIIFYGIMAAAATITGRFSTETAWDLFVNIVSKPLVELYKAIFQSQTGAPSPGP